MVSNRVSEWLTFCVIPFTEETGHLSRWDKELITPERRDATSFYSSFINRFHFGTVENCTAEATFLLLVNFTNMLRYFFKGVKLQIAWRFFDLLSWVPCLGQKVVKVEF